MLWHPYFQWGFHAGEKHTQPDSSRFGKDQLDEFEEREQVLW